MASLLLLDADALDARAVSIARNGIEIAMADLGFALGAAESEKVKKEIQDALDALQAALRDFIDPALFAVECRQEDAGRSLHMRETRRDVNAWNRKFA